MKKLILIVFLWGIAMFFGLLIAYAPMDSCTIIFDYLAHTLAIVGSLYLVVFFLFYRKKELYRLMMLTALSVLIVGIIFSIYFNGFSDHTPEVLGIDGPCPCPFDFRDK
ncbi:hypothetical protein DVR12_18025 [Chitinophaga silvatica]|uniref:Uncharacterized protein n=1 Tax=Chitinophaga silvatica TaxID=2282649 RepID=A0A3E1Y6A7_9BACT|nr:hypothetical protein [Chitinophaga silvatica]RFS20469.1 hypothetical protein DVR12_18025 [Chitinophaga silvatica]